MAGHDALRRERNARHGLADRPCTAAEAAACTTAVQAQDNLAARLGIRARAAGVTDADVVHAIEVERSIVRTWLLRGDDPPRPVRRPALAGAARSVRRSSASTVPAGPDSAFPTRCSIACAALLPGLLADGPRTRPNLRDALAAHGIVLDGPDPAGARSHTSSCTPARSGLICRGPDRGRENTFVLDRRLAARRACGSGAATTRSPNSPAATSPPTPPRRPPTSRPGPGCAGPAQSQLIRDELTPVEIAGRAGVPLRRGGAGTRGAAGAGVRQLPDRLPRPGRPPAPPSGCRMCTGRLDPAHGHAPTAG